MREGWRRIALGEVLEEFSRPVAVADLEEVRYAGVRWYAEGVYPRDPVPAGEVKGTTLTELRAGDITYNRMWATKASFGVAHDDVDGCHVTNDFPIFRRVSDDVLVSYIELLFKDPGFQSEAADRATGTTERRRLKQKDFLAITIALPPLDEQKRIVDLIAAVDVAIEATEAEAYAYEHLLDRQRDNLAAAPTRSLVEVIRSIDSGLSVASASSETDGPRVLKVSAIKRGVFDVQEHKRAGAATMPDRARVQNGDLLMTRSNTPDRVGYVAVATDIDEPTYMPDLIWRLVPDQSVVTPAYLAHVLSSPTYRELITGMASGTSASMQKINKTKVGGLQVPVPSIEVQEAFVRPLDQLAGATAAAHATAEALRRLRGNLLTALLSGEHEIPASYDRFLEDAA